MASVDSFGAKGTLDVDGKGYEIFRLDAVTGEGLPEDAVASLPFSLKVLLENLLRTEDGKNITADAHQGPCRLGRRRRPEQGDPVHPGARDHAGLHRRPVRGRPGHDA